MPYTVTVWDNDGIRHPVEVVDNLAHALAIAKGRRTLANRTVKVGHSGDAIRHWSRTIGARRNHWATHSTAECSR
jgi:hypothetical protein